MQLIYSGLQGANKLLIEQGMDIPIDASVTLEEWLVHPALRYVIAPIGFILLVLAAGVRIRGKDKEAEEPQASADDPMAVTDKREKKKILKDAAALRKKGQFEEAGDLVWSAKELDKAADYFIEGELFGRAAEIRHDQNRFIESADLHIKDGNHESAGAIFAQQEEWARAAECYHETGGMSVAAEMFDKAGEYAKAAKCYEEVEFHRHAASAYVKIKNWPKAAACLEEVFRSEFNTVKNDAAKLKELQKIAKQAGQLFHRAGDTEKAKHILKEAECWAEAGQVAMHLENFAEAAEYFRNAGRRLETSARRVTSIASSRATPRPATATERAVTTPPRRRCSRSAATALPQRSATSARAATPRRRSALRWRAPSNARRSCSTRPGSG